MMFCYEYVNLSDITLTDTYFYFVCSSTILLYTIHRYVGYHRVKMTGSLNERYLKIESLIPIYPYWAVCLSVMTMVIMYQMSFKILYILILPCTLSALYVLPVFSKSRRLRDFPFVKIFLIAITWTWFSTWYIINDMEHSVSTIIILEQMCFMIGITLPFDIRDLDIDKKDQVRTIATQIGKRRSQYLASIMIGLSFLGMCIILSKLSIIYISTISVYLLLYLFVITVIFVDKTYRKDIMITGLLDGCLLAKGLLGMHFVG